MSKLKEFMSGRPHDKDIDFEDAVMEYIETVEDVSIERSKQLKEAN